MLVLLLACNQVQVANKLQQMTNHLKEHIFYLWIKQFLIRL